MRQLTHICSGEFEKRQLVLIPEQNTWHSPSACVWTESRVLVPHKQSIASSYYSHIANFFTKMIAIPRPDLGIYIYQLNTLARMDIKNAHWLGQVKAVMMQISSMDPIAHDILHLQDWILFLVKTGQGNLKATSSVGTFAIVDRPEFQGLFPNVAVLDFTLQEVHALKPFLFAMGLANRYMSASVEEKSNVDDGMFDASLTEFFRLRAYDLFR